MRYIRGTTRYNLLSRGTVTASPGSDATHVLANLWNPTESLRWMVSALGADPYVNVDCDLLLGIGNMNTASGSECAGWTEESTGTGAASRTTVGAEVHAGAGAAKFVAGTGVASYYVDVTVLAGERLTLAAWLLGDGTNAAAVRVRNRQTGLYLQSNGTWSTVAAAISRTTATYGQVTLSFRVQTIDECQTPEVTLRIQPIGTAGTVFVDDVELYPNVNVVTLNGHNIDPLNTVQLLYSDDGAAFTVAATLTMKQPTFYGYLSTALAHRYWRLKSVGTNLSKIWISKLVLGYAETMTRSQRLGWSIKPLPDQARSETPTGQQWIHPRGSAYKRRGLHLPFRQATAAEFDEIRLDILRMTEHGRYPIVFIPKHSEHYVMHGHLTEDPEVTRNFNKWEQDLVFAEDPFPIV